MSDNLLKIEKSLGMLIEHSKHTTDSIKRLEDKLDDHINKEQIIYDHVSSKVKHSENRLRILTESAIIDCKERLVKVEKDCAPAWITLAVKGLYGLVSLILIASVTFFFASISNAPEDEKKSNTEADKRENNIEVVDTTQTL